MEEKPTSEIKTLLEWHAPGRPFIKKGRQYYLRALLLVVPIEVILFLFGQYILMLVVLSLFFLSVVLATVPPHDFHYRISSEGVQVEDHFFLWRELYDFYFKKHSGMDTVYIRTHALIPGALVLTLGDLDRERVKSALLSFLPFREYVKPSFMEKTADWLTKTFPLENTHPVN